MAFNSSLVGSWLPPTLMLKLRKTDLVFLALLVLGWGFYIFYDGQFKYDINETFSLSFIIAIEVTVANLLYGAWRYYSIKAGRRLGTKDILESMLPPQKNEEGQNNQDNK